MLPLILTATAMAGGGEGGALGGHVNGRVEEEEEGEEGMSPSAIERVRFQELDLLLVDVCWTCDVCHFMCVLHVTVQARAIAWNRPYALQAGF
jgi:hypothetical protein